MSEQAPKTNCRVRIQLVGKAAPEWVGKGFMTQAGPFRYSVITYPDPTQPSPPEPDPEDDAE